MKKSAKPKGPRHLDKHLFEAGLQCHKRLWLDYHEPIDEASPASRQELSRVGDEIRTLARTAFPKGVVVATDDRAAAAATTKKLVDDETPVLFDASFVADGVEACCDILVVHKDKRVDLFEIKAGTKVKHRYINDLALQAVVLEKCGLTVQRAYLLHINPRYVHREGEDFPPMQLLRSADVTAKVQKQVPNVARRIEQFQVAAESESSLELPMGTFCTNPFPCPYIDRCRSEGPDLPLQMLPELTRQQEIELHTEGIEEIGAINVDHPGLTFQQRRTITSVHEQQRLVEPFVMEELRECGEPLHFLAIAAVTEALPRFDKQRPWQSAPYAWSAKTVHPDGRIETADYVNVDRDDPRGRFVKTLAQHLEVGGTILCWGDDSIRELRALLDGVPDEKASVRALLGFEHLDMRQLFEAGVFDPGLLGTRDFVHLVDVLLDDDSGGKLEALDPEWRFASLQKARAPRVRSTTRDKIGKAIQQALAWQAERLSDLFDKFAGVEAKAGPKKPSARPSAKPLPKLPE